MHVSKRSALAVAGVAAIAFAVPALADQHSPAGGTGTQSCNDGTITWTPTNLWPPNHKYVPISISYADSDGDASGTASPETTMVAVTGVTEQDGNGPALDATVAETVNGSGKPGQIDAQPDPNQPATSGSDGGSAATWTEDIRAERSGTDGHGSGRTYVLTVQCTDSPAVDTNDTSEATGQTSTTTITVTVPHDQGVVKQ